MQNRTDMEDFNKQLKTLVVNIGLGIKNIEQQKLGIRLNEISPLSQILSEISIPNIEINYMSEISDLKT